MTTQLSPADLEADITNSPDDVYLLLLHKLENTEKEFYIFCVEGVDDKPFYSSYFNRSYSQKKWELLDCEGRKKVEQLFNLLKNESDFETRFRSVLFFVDKDLNPPPSHERLFVTCGYSFENYLCDIQTVYQVLQLYHLNPTPTRHEVQKKYKAQLELFCNEYFRIMAFVKENSKHNPSEPWVEKYNPEKCFERNWSRKANALQELSVIDDKNLNTEGYSPYHIRGKYVLTFLTWFIELYISSANKLFITKDLISHVPSIQALDDYFKRHIKEAS